MTKQETKHKLVDLREEVNKERDQEIIVAKQDYLDGISNARQAMKDTVKGIKETYRQTYADRKAELMTEVQED